MATLWRITLALIVGSCLFIGCSKSCKTVTKNENTEPPPTNFTPKENEEAELMALCLSGELVAPDSLYNQLLNDLIAIRNTFGDTIEIVNQLKFQPPWEAGCFMIGFDDTTFQQIRNGQYHAWDSLNQQYHLADIDTISLQFGGIVLLTFKGRLNPWRLCELYGTLPGAWAPSPNYIRGDRANIYARETESGITYLFRDAWDDCPSGCLHSEYWYFVFIGYLPLLIGHWAPDQTPQPPAWWEEAKLNKAQYCNP
jgi:hypothetical protein